MMIDLDELMVRTSGPIECPHCQALEVCDASALQFALQNLVNFRCPHCRLEWTLPVAEVTSGGDPIVLKVQAILASLANMRRR